MTETLEQIEFWIQNWRFGFPPAYIATVNLDYLVNCQAGNEQGIRLKSFLRTAEWVIADGKPVLWLSRWFGNGLKERVAGSDLVPLLGSVSAQKKWRIFVVGGTEESVAKTSAQWEKNHGGSSICGTYSGKVNLLCPLNEKEIVDRINASNADILLIALGSPKQEHWFAKVKPKLKVSVAIGIGGTFEMVSGKVKRAPKWIQDIGAEWIVRLIQEPARLFRRYAVDGLWFLKWVVSGFYGLFLLRAASAIYDAVNTCRKYGPSENEIESVLGTNSKFLTGYDCKKMNIAFRDNYSGAILKYGIQKYLETRFSRDQILVQNIG